MSGTGKNVRLTAEAVTALRQQKSIGVTYSQVILKLVAIREEHLGCSDPDPSDPDPSASPSPRHRREE